MRSWEQGPHAGNSTLIRRDTGKFAFSIFLPVPSPPPSLAIREHRQKAATYKPRKESLPETDNAGKLISRLQWEIHFCCSSHTVYGILSWPPRWLKQYSSYFYYHQKFVSILKQMCALLQRPRYITLNGTHGHLKVCHKMEKSQFLDNLWRSKEKELVMFSWLLCWGTWV